MSRYPLFILFIHEPLQQLHDWRIGQQNGRPWPMTSAVVNSSSSRPSLCVRFFASRFQILRQRFLESNAVP